MSPSIGGSSSLPNLTNPAFIHDRQPAFYRAAAEKIRRRQKALRSGADPASTRSATRAPDHALGRARAGTKGRAQRTGDFVHLPSSTASLQRRPRKNGDCPHFQGKWGLSPFLRGDAVRSGQGGRSAPVPISSAAWWVAVAAKPGHAGPEDGNRAPRRPWTSRYADVTNCAASRPVGDGRAAGRPWLPSPSEAKRSALWRSPSSSPTSST